MDLIKVAEQAFATNKQHPQFFPGDTITVAYRIKEGNKERIQQYRGVVIKITGEGEKKRRLSTASPSTSMVRCVALSCITCVVSPVRRLASRSVASSRRTRHKNPPFEIQLRTEANVPRPLIFCPIKSCCEVSMMTQHYLIPMMRWVCRDRRHWG